MKRTAGGAAAVGAGGGKRAKVKMHHVKGLKRGRAKLFGKKR